MVELCILEPIGAILAIGKDDTLTSSAIPTIVIYNVL